MRSGALSPPTTTAVVEGVFTIWLREAGWQKIGLEDGCGPREKIYCGRITATGSSGPGELLVRRTLRTLRGPCMRLLKPARFFLGTPLIPDVHREAVGDGPENRDFYTK